MKKKILYIDKNPDDYGNDENFRIHSVREDYILNGLRESYDVKMIYNLHSEELETVLNQENFDLLLTHLPFHPKLFNYEDSLRKLEGIIKNYSEMRVVVYTGADPRSVNYVHLKRIGVRGIVRKKIDDKWGSDKAEDFDNIKKCLERIFRD